VDDSVLEKLEFDAVRALIAAHCATRLGKRLALSLTPTHKIALIREWLGQVEQMMRVVEDRRYPPLAGVHDVREYVRASMSPIPLEAHELADIAETLVATSLMRQWFAKLGEESDLLIRIGDRIEDLSAIAVVINESIDSRGQVQDYASPKLASLRRTIEQTKDHVKRVFDRLLKQPSLTKMLQYGGATLHADRTVLPLKAQYRGRIPGIIHRTSDTGATLFVEPSEAVQLNNTIVRLRDEESKEITKILRVLTQHVQVNAKAILDTLRAVGVIDVIGAKCRYAHKRHCICPDIDEQGVMDLHEARHPLLMELFEQASEENEPPQEVVPIDVRLGDDFDVLMITGPNTGGKTVTLKTVGLMAIMTQCGMPIPAGEGSRMPIFSQIFIDVGDEQSLQSSLSTFSGHLSNILKMLSRSNDQTLVLIDEVGAGTDPDEGAAIGRAIVTELLSRGVKALITTHLSALKAIAFTTERVDNASVEFDPNTLEPTYHLRLGEPGNSNALIIAQRLGMSKRMIARAKSYLDDQTRALSQAIEGTLASRRKAELARKDARDAAIEAKREREKFEASDRDMKQSQEKFNSWTKWINDLTPGDEVFIAPLKRKGKVVRMQLHKQSALVSSGAMDVEVSLRNLEIPTEDE